MNWELFGTLAAVGISVSSFLYGMSRDKTKDVWELATRFNKLDADRHEWRATVVRLIEDKHDEALRHFGETMSAYSEHIRLLELELYKNFVRIDTFKDSMQVHTLALNERLDRIDKRFDELREDIKSSRL